MACFKPDKKRKVDSKNRKFKTEWTDNYAFVLPVWSTKPMCLICNETVALVKSGNVKRHYETKHAHFEQKYRQNSEVRERKINHLQSYQATCSVIVSHTTRACTHQPHNKSVHTSTYCCESAFSTMNMVKNKYRSTRTNEHLHQCLRLAFTPFMAKFKPQKSVTFHTNKATSPFVHSSNVFVGVMFLDFDRPDPGLNGNLASGPFRFLIEYPCSMVCQSHCLFVFFSC